MTYNVPEVMLIPTRSFKLLSCTPNICLTIITNNVITNTLTDGLGFNSTFSTNRPYCAFKKYVAKSML